MGEAFQARICSTAEVEPDLEMGRHEERGNVARHGGAGEDSSNGSRWLPFDHFKAVIMPGLMNTPMAIETYVAAGFERGKLKSEKGGKKSKKSKDETPVEPEQFAEWLVRTGEYDAGAGEFVIGFPFGSAIPGNRVAFDLAAAVDIGTAIHTDRELRQAPD